MAHLGGRCDVVCEQTLKLGIGDDDRWACVYDIHVQREPVRRAHEMRNGREHSAELQVAEDARVDVGDRVRGELEDLGDG
jgi:hypothetical protein